MMHLSSLVLRSLRLSINKERLIRIYMKSRAIVVSHKNQRIKTCTHFDITMQRHNYVKAVSKMHLQSIVFSKALRPDALFAWRQYPICIKRIFYRFDEAAIRVIVEVVEGCDLI
jgi:hypothetical protein